MKEGWSYKKLGEVARVQNGFAFDSKLFNENAIGTPLIRIRDIKRAYTMTYTTETCSTDYIIEDGHVLIGMDGDFNVCIWKGGHAYLNQRVCRVVPSDAILPRFIYYFLPFPLKRINDKTSFSTVKHLSSKQVNDMLVPIPPLQEQHSIVSRLDTAFSHIDALKSNAEKQLNEARKLFQAELTECMKPKEGWEEKKLGDIADIKGGKRVPKGYKLENFDTGHRYIRVSDFDDDGTIDLTNIQYISEEVYNQIKNYTITDNDVYLSIAGTIGKAGIIQSSLNGSNLTENACKLIFTKPVDKRYIYLYTKSDDFKKQIDKATKQTSQPKLAITRLAQFIVPLPPLSDQHSIVSHLDSLSSNIRKLEELQQKTIAECDALKQAMLREVFE